MDATYVGEIDYRCYLQLYIPKQLHIRAFLKTERTNNVLLFIELSLLHSHNYANRHPKLPYAR